MHYHPVTGLKRKNKSCLSFSQPSGSSTKKRPRLLICSPASMTSSFPRGNHKENPSPWHSHTSSLGTHRQRKKPGYDLPESNTERFQRGFMSCSLKPSLISINLCKTTLCIADQFLSFFSWKWKQSFPLLE